MVDKVSMVTEKSMSRSHSTKKGHEKVPKSIHKAEREKMKREHVNELFYALANSLELAQLNNGKASILSEATRLLKDMYSRIESLKRENAALSSESQYVTVERNELKDENSALEAQIKNLRGELEERVAQSKLDLNVTPVSASHFAVEPALQQAPTVSPVFAVEPALQQAPTVSPVFVIPFRSGLKAYPEPDSAQLAPQSTSNVRKPHARYPTMAESWASQLLGDQSEPGKELLQTNSNIS